MFQTGNNLILCVAIVAQGKAKQVIHLAKEFGVPGATVFLGHGTSSKGILSYLMLNNPHKEIVLMVTDGSRGDYAIEQIVQAMQIKKPNHGIIFTLPINAVIGCRSVSDNPEGRNPNMSNYQAIYTIVDKGKAEWVIEAAAKGGASGGTVINARGSGIHETEKIFQMAIEPEKELVLILAKCNLVEGICQNIREELHIDDPGKGIIFVQDVRSAFGLFEKE
ncbi:MAG: P-II family nitrogen regulator [Candidatus Izemoplasmatales bacterium]|nr:P-II family nitrogen regulator [Candidatus Izemoplasmatales bacterium]